MTGAMARKDQLARLLAAARAGWVIEGEDRESRLEGILNEVDALAGRLSALIGLSGDLLDEMEREIGALAPLAESFASPMSADIRAAVYVLLRGGELRSLTYEYDRLARSRLFLRIATWERRELEFESNELWDAEILRHLGLMKMGGRPLVDGYYAMRSRD
jgi:hypothetical protein